MVADRGLVTLARVTVMRSPALIVPLTMMVADPSVKVGAVRRRRSNLASSPAPRRSVAVLKLVGPAVSLSTMSPPDANGRGGPEPDGVSRRRPCGGGGKRHSDAADRGAEGDSAGQLRRERCRPPTSMALACAVVLAAGLVPSAVTVRMSPATSGLANEQAHGVAAYGGRSTGSDMALLPEGRSSRCTRRHH